MVYKITSSKKFQLTGSTKGVITISKSKKGQAMKVSDISKVAEMIKKKYKDKDFKYYIQAYGNLSHPITFKSFDSEEIDLEMIDNYLEGKVKNKAKFDVLYSIQIGYIVKDD